MNDDELRRDIAEEDDLRRLLHRGDRPPVPPFASVAERARRPTGAPSAVAAMAAIVVVLVAAIVLARLSSDVPVAASPSTAAATASPLSTRIDCLPSYLALARDTQSAYLVTSLSKVELTDAMTNQMRWTIEFLSAANAPANSTVSLRVQIVAARNSLLQLIGYEDPVGATLKDDDVLTLAPCSRAAMVVRTAGPLLDGTWPYVVTIEKVGLPEGRTVSQKLEVTLTCSNKTWSCAQAPAGATQPPAPTPNMAVLDRRFGIVYSGVGQAWEPGSAPQLRREGDTQSAGELMGSFFNQPYGNTSPDGRRYVYAGEPQNGPWGLYLLDGAKPTDRRLLDALPNEIPGRAIWSGDGQAIAFTAQDSGATQGVAPKYDSIRTLDLATGKVSEIARVTDGSYYQLLGWDRASGTIAATTAPNGRPAAAYLVIGPSGTRTLSLDSDEYHGWEMRASPDSRTVAGIRCEAASACALWTWPLADFAARVDRHLGSNLSLGIIGWRPGANELVLSVSTAQPAAADAHIEVWSSTGRRMIAANVSSPPSRPFLRADGSAVIVPGYGSGLVIDLATGATSAIPFPAPTGPWELALPAASVRLDAP